MRVTVLSSTFAVALLVGLPASAQILGGQVGANVGVGATLPSTQPLTGQVGQTMRGTTGAVHGTMRDTRDTLRHRHNASVGLSARTDADASANRNGTGAGLNISTGAMVHASDGAMLGSVVRTTRNASGRVESLVVRTADGTLRAIPASGARVQGDVVVTGMTQSQFDRSPSIR